MASLFGCSIEEPHPRFWSAGITSGYVVPRDSTFHNLPSGKLNVNIAKIVAVRTVSQQYIGRLLLNWKKLAFGPYLFYLFGTVYSR